VAEGVPDDDGAQLTAGVPGQPPSVTGRIRWN
jgi:hypothetical protein